MHRHNQSGQVIILVAFALLALIGSAALVLLAGSVEWQKNQLQQLADQAALDSAMKIGIGCNAASANAVITEADNFVASQRARTGALGIAGGTCATPYTGTDTFAGGLSETIHYPYREHQQQVEVILTLTLPISFGTQMGQTSTSVVRRAVALQLAGSTTALSTTSLFCTGGQVNIAGSVATQNPIALSGSCALYAHARFDATSGTYSDLGDVAVYTGGQSWNAAGGLCSAGANAGSSNAICADGSEVSGHVPVACGTIGTNAFLSAGDVATDPNPCAAGVAPRPVAPLSSAQPPEPDTDASAIATLQNSAGGLLGAACTAGGAYSTPIKVNGSIVATGLGPAPTKDAGGVYHYKPSCYGYLDPSPLTGGIAKVQIGPEIGPARKDIVVTLPSPSTTGTLLVVTLRSDTNPSNKPFTPPSASWLPAVENFQHVIAHTQIWYYPNNPGGITTADFGLDPASIDGVGQMSEWSGAAAAALDLTGTLTQTTNQSAVTIATSGSVTTAGELVVTDMGALQQAGQTYNPGAGWTNIASDMSVEGFASDYEVNPVAGLPASESVSVGTPTKWASVVAAFKPAAAGASGVVLDPGFYYFNGSGSAGVGGICLNGSRLMARDVTLEFVNQASFSSGTCAAGGGAACAGACAFGSTPCSISACPPNAPFDAASGGGYTWFAAPCSSAPTGDSSCAASSWCPNGDRACWNTLIWEAPGATGQIAIKGSSVTHWLLGSVFWAGACADSVNGASMIEGTLQCGSLSISAGAGARTAIGGDYGVSTALVEAVLVE
ncbi:MAG TPA: pilus assembly protein TadG-related protein [Candidatus Dormibacteraeota bacterium]|nr:pilus assembly protein TadG-related protein [Candidatus Dormibacteraeota bacterium]